MALSDNRSDDILQCIVESYIETAEPVGSRAVSKKYSAHLSPATIRNVMADLEEMGLIHQPHTSAGRVPTDRGYRYYVDSLLDWGDFESTEIPDIASVFRNIHDIEDAAERMSRFVADLTGNAGILFLKNVKRISYFGDLRREIPSESQSEASANDRLYVEGTSHIIEQPEFRDAARIGALLRALEFKEELAALLERDLGERRLHIHIGNEVDFGEVLGVSMVVKEYCVDETPIGCLGVMGPTRMKYDKVIGAVNALARAMTEFLSQ